MALMPAADLEIDVPLVRRLLAEQAPDLAGLPLRLAANGWDNAMFRLGDDLAVRLPRREAAVPLLRKEQRWLPELTAGLAVATPAPLRCGAPSSFFPWPWSVVPWIEGTTAARVSPGQRRLAAGGLAEFVAAFQRPAPPEAPRNPVRGVPLPTRDPQVRRRLAGGLVPHAGQAGRLWRELSAAPPWTGEPVWLHGDLHPENLILREGRLAAVIDFGDLAAGDPATDLAAAGWSSTRPGGAASGTGSTRRASARRLPSTNPRGSARGAGRCPWPPRCWTRRRIIRQSAGWGKRR
ncbi:aminoglycoside phosphotransferase family protein [Arthrobacter crystallopoietes]|uniref:aminoglycoside phosphotransferase family protein n=1 Tax=Crystallibacter crystallopoietes TaxID=37928 RepID=UPI003D1EBAD3